MVLFGVVWGHTGCGDVQPYHVKRVTNVTRLGNTRAEGELKGTFYCMWELYGGGACGAVCAVPEKE